MTLRWSILPNIFSWYYY